MIHTADEDKYEMYIIAVQAEKDIHIKKRTETCNTIFLILLERVTDDRDEYHDLIIIDHSV